MSCTSLKDYQDSLARAIQEGQAEKLWPLWETVRPYMISIAAPLTRYIHQEKPAWYDVDDLEQDLPLVLLQVVKAWDPEAYPRFFMYLAVEGRQRVFNLKRHLFTREGYWLERVRSEPPEFFRRERLRRKPAPTPHMTRGELSMDLESALASLGARDRLALLLHLRHGYSHGAIGGFLGISAYRSAHLVSEAKKALRGRLPHPDEI